MRPILFSLFVFLCVPPALAAESVKVRMQTNMGDFVLELAPDKAPKTVANFLKYVRSGFYDGTIFHRVIANFMIQGGGYTPDYQRKPTEPPIINEADNGLKNMRGTIAMARTGDPHSATAQFFINVTSNPFLDFATKSVPQGWGYAVFGKVTEGLETIAKIKSLPTGPAGPFGKDVPQTQVVIQHASVIE